MYYSKNAGRGGVNQVNYNNPAYDKIYEQAQLRLVPPAGTIAQGGAAPAASPTPAAPSASLPNDADKVTS